MGVPFFENGIQRTPIRDNIGYAEALAETRILPSDAPSIAHFLTEAEAAATRDVLFDYIPDCPAQPPYARPFTIPGVYSLYADIVAASAEPLYEPTPTNAGRVSVASVIDIVEWPDSPPGATLQIA